MSGALKRADIRKFHARLHHWYDAHGRKALPWRTTDDAYAIYISETMLQQTQVKTVLERFYHPFLTRFPTLKSLAKADSEDVLRAWQGLGYYSRALNLHKAAQQSGGTLPRSVEELIKLPGIGRNTAHAIAAFAYRLPVPVMEANLKRVLCRIFALSVPNDAQLWEHAHSLLDSDEPFDYNQAMMDIGAMVCIKRAPDCPACPANNICAGKASPESYPAPKAKKVERIRKKRIVVFTNSKGQVYATARKTRFLGGLYHFVELAEDTKEAALGTKHYKLTSAAHIGDIRQVYSHFTLEAEIYLIRAEGSGSNWHGGNALSSLPFSAAEQKILQLLAGAGAANS